MSDYRELLIGCGHAREKRITVPGTGLEWRGLVTLDSNPAVRPDIVCDLDSAGWAIPQAAERCAARLWPLVEPAYPGSAWGDYARFTPDLFDEVHAYEVLEHLGAQGDAVAFFKHFSEIWRVLKPGGYLCATVPSRFSPWLWGDPSHRRAILPESLVFLDQTQYQRQLDGPHKTAMSDFRHLYKADFNIVQSGDDRSTFAFILQAVKPSRLRRGSFEELPAHVERAIAAEGGQGG